MADNRKEYTVAINGVDHTVLLSPEDAERYGEAAREVKAAKAAPANKAATAQDK